MRLHASWRRVREEVEVAVIAQSTDDRWKLSKMLAINNIHNIIFTTLELITLQHKERLELAEEDALVKYQ